MQRALLLGASAIALLTGVLWTAPSDGQSTATTTTNRLTPYFPYPPGIVPANLLYEIRRVQLQIHCIFNNYLNQSQAYPPLTFVGNPPIPQGTGYQALQILGGLLNY